MAATLFGLGKGFTGLALDLVLQARVLSTRHAGLAGAFTRSSELRSHFSVAPKHLSSPLAPGSAGIGQAGSASRHASTRILSSSTAAGGESWPPSSPLLKSFGNPGELQNRRQSPWNRGDVRGFQAFPSEGDCTTKDDAGKDQPPRACSSELRGIVPYDDSTEILTRPGEPAQMLVRAYHLGDSIDFYKLYREHATVSVRTAP